jgi:uncharacterized protein
LKLDCHVHIVGNGSSGSGCWLAVSGWHQPLARLMLRGIGLPSSALSADLDTIYVQHLLQQVQESSLDAVVILAQDRVYDEEGRPIEGAGSFYVPNDYVLELARRHKEFLPGVSIHPARPDALAELDRCLSAGAVLMKCLPNCHNINCNDPRFRPFWKRMAEAGLPLLAHTGGEHTLPVLKPEFADPRVLTLPLECGVKVIAAHAATKSGVFDPDYFKVFVEMIGRFENLYGDNSAFNLPFRSRHMRDCLQTPLVDRVLHGSDYPVPVHGHWAWLRRFLSWRDFRKCERLCNVVERDYRLKRAVGFPEQVFERAATVLRL